MLKKIVIFILLIGITGCASTNKNNASGSNNLFAKISNGMSINQVHDLIGEPTSSDIRTTKGSLFSFVAHYITTEYYKGEGRIIFNSRLKVMEIKYDPSEDGH
jgi:hypothetical protein